MASKIALNLTKMSKKLAKLEHQKLQIKGWKKCFVALLEGEKPHYAIFPGKYFVNDDPLKCSIHRIVRYQQIS